MSSIVDENPMPDAAPRRGRRLMVGTLAVMAVLAAGCSDGGSTAPEGEASPTDAASPSASSSSAPSEPTSSGSDSGGSDSAGPDSGGSEPGEESSGSGSGGVVEAPTDATVAEFCGSFDLLALQQATGDQNADSGAPAALAKLQKKMIAVGTPADMGAEARAGWQWYATYEGEAAYDNLDNDALVAFATYYMDTCPMEG